MLKNRPQDCVHIAFRSARVSDSACVIAGVYVDEFTLGQPHKHRDILIAVEGQARS